MEDNVVSIARGRKLRAERAVVMHYVPPGKRKTPFSQDRDCCSNCDICGHWCCNAPDYTNPDNNPEGATVHAWTDDLETWASHSHPCTQIPLLGGSHGEATEDAGGPDIAPHGADAPGDTFPGPGGGV